MVKRVMTCFREESNSNLVGSVIKGEGIVCEFEKYSSPSEILGQIQIGNVPDILFMDLGWGKANSELDDIIDIYQMLSQVRKRDQYKIFPISGDQNLVERARAEGLKFAESRSNFTLPIITTILTK